MDRYVVDGKTEIDWQVEVSASSREEAIQLAEAHWTWNTRGESVTTQSVWNATKDEVE